MPRSKLPVADWRSEQQRNLHIVCRKVAVSVQVLAPGASRTSVALQGGWFEFDKFKLDRTLSFKPLSTCVRG